MNVVVFARVSSREQREGYSIDAQLRADRNKAEKSGWSIAKEFVVTESAKRGAERKAFNEMFKWVKANARREKIDAILSHKLDRVCRNMRDAVRLVFVENQFGPGAALSHLFVHALDDLGSQIVRVVLRDGRHHVKRQRARSRSVLL